MHGTIGTMQIMDQTGHTEITWDSDKEPEVEVAKATFESLTKKGYSAFRVNQDDERGERMTKFDPRAGKLLMVPQLVGG